jgi:hypothetical protein
MKRLEAAWRDFGGPSASDIFVEFGITAEEFYRRLHKHAGSHPDARVSSNRRPAQTDC